MEPVNIAKFWVIVDPYSAHLSDHINILSFRFSQTNRGHVQNVDLLRKHTALRLVFSELKQEPSSQEATKLFPEKTLDELKNKVKELESLMKRVMHSYKHGSVEVSLFSGALTCLSCITDAINSISRNEPQSE